MNIGFIFTLIVSFAILYIGIITTYHDKTSATNKLFASISLATVAWSLANYFSLYPTLLQEITWIRLVIFFAVPHVILFYFFTKNFPQKELSIPKLELYGLSITGLCMMVLTMTPFIFSGLRIVKNKTTPTPGILIPLFGIFVVVILIAGIIQIIKKYRQANKKEKTSWRSMLIGFTLSYTMLIVTNFILVNTTNDIRFVLYAPLFMLPSILGTAYSIIRYQLLNVKAITTEIIIFVLLSTTLIQILISQTTTQLIFNSLLFCAFLVTGIFLIKSVLIEVEQKEKLAVLNKNLQLSIKQRESLVHLVTHKVKGSFTRTKLLFNGMLDGTFGEISEEIRNRAAQGLDFDNNGLRTVDLVLNVSNLQNGIIKYDMQKVDFKNLVLETINEKKLGVEAKGLKLENEIKPASADGDGEYNIMGDTIWIKEAISNLIENSTKYTREGTITISLTNQDKTVLLSVKDTGVGITEEDKKNLFTEGGRGKDSIKVNVDSTGYGLYTVKLVIDAHKGRVWAESEGAGKGSTFFIELPKA